MVLMRGHNICFHQEIRKIIFDKYPQYPLLSGTLPVVQACAIRLIVLLYRNFQTKYSNKGEQNACNKIFKSHHLEINTCKQRKSSKMWGFNNNSEKILPIFHKNVKYILYAPCRPTQPHYICAPPTALSQNCPSWVSSYDIYSVIQSSR